MRVFEQAHYTENFVQCILDAIPGGAQGATLVVGGDGRYFSKPAIQKIIRLAAGNGVKKLVIGQAGILSTPAASHLIRLRKATGGILLTASHNPGGPDADFGIKYNMENGGPAPEAITDRIYQGTTAIHEYRVVDGDDVDLEAVGLSAFGPMEVEVVDSVKDYVDYLGEIFDLDLIRTFLSSGTFTVRFDGLHGVTGPYAKALFIDKFGLDETALQNCTPSPNFGGGHPDPNLTYAKSLVDAVETESISFGAASDGDGDRNMIIGKGAFVNPSDSVAIIADWAEKAIPYFAKGVRGLARSMPTSGAIDRVAKAHNLEVFEVPTGTPPHSPRLEILREPDGCRASVHLWRRIVRYRLRPYPRKGRALGGRRYVSHLTQHGSASWPQPTKRSRARACRRCSRRTMPSTAATSSAGTTTRKWRARAPSR